MKIRNLLLAAGLAATAFSAQAQEGRIELSKEAIGQNTSLVVFNLAMDNVSGVQFEVHYPDGASIGNLSSCLDGVPDSHMKSYTTCKNFPDRNILLVVISDIGMSRPLATGALGFAEFDAGDLAVGDFQIENLLALDTNGDKIRGNAESIVELQID